MLQSTAVSSQLSSVEAFPQGSVSVPRPAVGAILSEAHREGAIRILVDNQDLTSSAHLYEDRISWAPDEDLKPGLHIAQVIVNDEEGATFTATWYFTVEENLASALQHNGCRQDNVVVWKGNRSFTRFRSRNSNFLVA